MYKVHGPFSILMVKFTITAYTGVDRDPNPNPMTFRSLKKKKLPFDFNIDVEECAAEVNDCDVNADCFNTDGSYNCTCKSGYSGNGTTCNGMTKRIIELFSVCNVREDLNAFLFLDSFLCLRVYKRLYRKMISTLSWTTLPACKQTLSEH